MWKKLKLWCSAGIIALGAAACTTAQEQAVINDLLAACNILGPGSKIVADIANSLVGGQIVATVADIVGAIGGPVCTDFVNQVAGYIQEINNAGGTATVTVNTNTPSGMRLLAAISAKLQSHGVRYSLRAGSERLHSKAGGVLVFVVPPA